MRTPPGRIAVGPTTSWATTGPRPPAARIKAKRPPARWRWSSILRKRDASLKQPMINQKEANEHARNDPPRLPLRRGGFFRNGVLAKRAALRGFVDRPLSPPPKDGLDIVIRCGLLPR